MASPPLRPPCAARGFAPLRGTPGLRPPLAWVPAPMAWLRPHCVAPLRCAGRSAPPSGHPCARPGRKGGGRPPPFPLRGPLPLPREARLCRAPRFAKAHCVRAKASAKADPQTRVPGRGLAQRLAAPLKGTPCFIYSAALLRGLRPPWRVPPKLARGRANTEQPRGDGTPLKVITPDGVNTQHPGRQLGRWLPRLGRRVLGRTEPKNQHPNNSLVPKLSYIKS